MYIGWVLSGSLFIVNAGPHANYDKFDNTSNKTILTETQKVYFYTIHAKYPAVIPSLL